jgi:hypothetical protein
MARRIERARGRDVVLRGETRKQTDQESNSAGSRSAIGLIAK